MYLKDELHLAARQGDTVRVAAALERGAPVDEPDKRGWTPLMHAAAFGSSHVVRALLDRGARLEARCAEPAPLRSCFRRAPPSNAGATPLLLAAAHGNKKTLHALITAGADLDAVDDEGRSALDRAVLGGHLGALRALLHRRRDFSADVLGRALRLALQGGHAWAVSEPAASERRSPMVQALLAAGAPPGAADEEGWTPLHAAAACGDAAMVQRLLAAGADIHATTKWGETPLSAAVMYSRGSVAALRAAGARMTLHEAVLLRDAAAAEALLDAGADVEALDRSGQTALRLAAIVGSAELTALLIWHGADVNAAERYTGARALSYVRPGPEGEPIAALLRAAGAVGG